MRYRCDITFPAVAVALVLNSAICIAADTTPLKVSVECVRAPVCRYEGKDIQLRIQMFNASNVEVYLTAEYMRKSGPFTMIRDTKSGGIWYAERRLGPDELLTKYNVIRPGDAITLYYRLAQEDLSHFKTSKKGVSVYVELSYPGYWFTQGGKLNEFGERAGIQIDE